jgi:LysM repeat protein
VGVAATETKPPPTTTSSTAPAKVSPKTPTKVSDSGKTYVVAKGDNPVTIAKKFKVPYDDLVALNHIDDPRKLKIGQKLLIPAKSAKKNE